MLGFCMSAMPGRGRGRGRPRLRHSEHSLGPAKGGHLDRESATSTAEVDLEGRAPELAAAAALLDDPEDRITATEAA